MPAPIVPGAAVERLARPLSFLSPLFPLPSERDLITFPWIFYCWGGFGGCGVGGVGLVGVVCFFGVGVCFCFLGCSDRASVAD